MQIPTIFKYTGMDNEEGTQSLSLGVTIGDSVYSFDLQNPNEHQVFISKMDQVERWVGCNLWNITEVLDDDPIIATFERR